MSWKLSLLMYEQRTGMSFGISISRRRGFETSLSVDIPLRSLTAVRQVLFSALLSFMRYHRFLRYSTYRRYAIFILTVFFSWYGLQAWVNLRSIDTSIQQTKQQVASLNEHTAYLEIFYKNYLQSEYAPYFLGHENGTLYQGEYIVRLRHPTDKDEAILPEIEQKDSIKISTPQESWHYFIEKRLPFLIEWGIIQIK